LIRWPLRVQRVWRAIRIAPEFRSWWRVVAVEMFRFDGRPRRWSLRKRPGSVVLRSGSSDIDIFEEIFIRRIYDPPPVVARALTRQPVRLIADLGGNAGLFAVRALADYPEATVVSFEPDAANLGVMRACRDESPHADRWQIVAGAAGPEDGSVPFLAGRGAMARRAQPWETGLPGALEVSIADCFPVLSRADLVKIDIEGGEWAILADRRFRQLPARAVALEYHAGPGPARSRQVALEELAAAGYSVLCGPESEGCAQAWGWRA